MPDYIKKAQEIVNKFNAEANDIIKMKADFDTQAQKKYEKIMNTDYTSDLKETFSDSLESLENIYDNWANIQKNTKGLDFRISDYIKTLKPTKIPVGKVEDAFNKLVHDGREAIIAVSRSQSVLDDIEPQKRFCQCLVDLRYIVKNSEKLLLDTGIQSKMMTSEEAKVDDFLLKCKETIKNRQAILKKETDYAVSKLNAEINNDFKELNEKKIGNNFSDTADYKFLIGFKKYNPKQNLSNEMIKKIDYLINNPKLWQSTIPVYYDPKDSNGVIIIKASKDILDPFDNSKKLLKLIRNIYFSLSVNLPANNLLFAGMESASESTVGALATTISKNLGSNAIIGLSNNKAKVVANSNDLDDYLKNLENMTNERSTAINLSDDIDDIFDYNKNNPDNMMPIILNVINYYPHCLKDNKNAEENILNILLRGVKKGILSIVCVDKDSDSKFLSDKRLKADIIEIDDDFNMQYNGAPFINDILTDDFNSEDFYLKLNEREREANILSLNKVIAITENKISRYPLTKFYDKITVPFGMDNDTYYNFTFGSCDDKNFTFLVGNTSSGKSSLLHLMILSMAYFYAPDEIELYLADFKTDGTNAPEFSKYIKNTDEDNLYIPHIKYLSLKSKTENVLDLFDLINSLHNKRTEQYRGAGVSDMKEYNMLPDVKNGKLPKMPFALFIIDEYNQMFNDSDMNLKISGIIANLIKKVRASGIGIIFSGQSIASDLTSETISQTKNRIVLNLGTADAITKVLPCVDFTVNNQYAIELEQKGMALISTDGGLQDLRHIKSAFVGNDTQKKNIARRIREKYKDFPETIQVIANEEGLYPLGDGLKCNEFANENKDKSYEIFNLPIGVSAASLLKTNMVFSTAKSATNYIALASPNKLYMLERISSLMYLHDVNKNVMYFSNVSEGESFFKGFGNKASLIRNKISKYTNDFDKANKLSEIYEEYQKREQISNNSSNFNFEPMYLIFHNIEWLYSQIAIISNNQKQEKKKNKVDDEDISTLNDLGLGDLGMSIAGIDDDKTEESSKQYGIVEIQDIVKKLYKYGNRYKIFVLVSLETNDYIDKLIDNDTNNKYKDYTIYGSYEEMKNKKTIDSDDGALYVNPYGVKIRAFDIESNANDFWKELK